MYGVDTSLSYQYLIKEYRQRYVSTLPSNMICSVNNRVDLRHIIVLKRAMTGIMLYVFLVNPKHNFLTPMVPPARVYDLEMCLPRNSHSCILNATMVYCLRFSCVLVVVLFQA